MAIYRVCLGSQRIKKLATLDQEFKFLGLSLSDSKFKYIEDSKVLKI